MSKGHGKNNHKKKLKGNSSNKNFNAGHNHNPVINTSTNVNNDVDKVYENLQNINKIIEITSSLPNNSLQTSSNSGSSNSNNILSVNAENKVNNTNSNLQNINTIILSGIESVRNIESQISQADTINNSDTASNNTPDTDKASADYCQTIRENVSKTATLIQDINNLKLQLVRLEFDPWESEYFNFYINPLLITLVQLATTSYGLASSVSSLYSSAVVSPKHSKLKDTIHSIYDMNEKCEDIYKVLRRRIDCLLEHTKNC